MPNHAAPPRSRKHPKRRKYVIAAALVGPLLMAGAAYAYFIANTAVSHVDVENAPSFTINISDPTGTPLVPGAGSQTVTFTVTNALPHAQTVPGEEYAVTSDAVGGIWDTVSNSWDDSCLASWFTLTGTSGATLPAVLQSGQSLLNGSMTVVMPADPADNQGACSGTSPQVSVTVG